MTMFSLQPHRVYKDGLPISDVLKNWYEGADWAVAQKLATYRYESAGLKYAHCLSGVEIVNVNERDATGLEDLL